MELTGGYRIIPHRGNRTDKGNQDKPTRNYTSTKFGSAGNLSINTDYKEYSLVN